MPLPTLDTGRRAPRRTSEVVFAVYAPFGLDPTLSLYPNAAQAKVRQQALVVALQAVATQGVNVSALVDLFDDDSYLIEIPAGQPKQMSIVSAWKQDMSAPQALAGFLRRTHDRFRCDALVLALEGHGGAFVPDIDYTRLTSASITQWSAGGQSGTVKWTQSSTQTGFESDGGSPILPVNSPELPVNSPELPASRLPMSTWALGEALRNAIKSGVPRPAVIHFANCYSASVELLHTVAPYAGFATGYANYDFFTAGQTYPKVFARLRAAGSATAAQLAQWFAQENGALLAAKQNHPAIGAAVDLRRMKGVAAAIDGLGAALTAALVADRATNLPLVEQAAAQAQHYDTEPGFELAVPDQFMDIGSFAARLQALFPPGAVATAAAAVQAAAANVWQFGGYDRPWLDENQIWDFRSRTLGFNIFFPDPDLRGLWDWRSPYYLAGTVDPTKPPAQRHVIDFLADHADGTRPPWVQFIVEYHKTTDFVGFYPARPFFFPIFNARFQPEQPHPGDGDNPPPTPGGPGRRR